MTRTDQYIKDVPATVMAVTSPTKEVSYQIMRGGTSAPLGSCNLPLAFEKDGLQVIVSGYLLTFPGSELINLTPLPFEVTNIQLRK